MIAPLRARKSLPHSDWSSSAYRLPEAQKAPHLVATFSALKGPAQKTESSEGHRPRVCYVAKNFGATLLGLLGKCARYTASRKSPPSILTGVAKRSRTKARSFCDFEGPFG